MSQLGDNLKLIRSLWGLTQTEFGTLVGASRGMIMQYENRGTQPKAKVMRKIIKVTRLSQEQLVNTKLSDADVPCMQESVVETIDNLRHQTASLDETNLLTAQEPDEQYGSRDLGKSEKYQDEIVRLNHLVEKLQIRIVGLERELEWANEALKTKDQSIKILQSQLDDNLKKRDSYHDNPGDSGPTRTKQAVAGK